MPQLSYAQERQQQDQWCWAAVAVSVSAFLHPPQQFGQCGVVQKVANLNGCCAAPSSCNVTGSLRNALAFTGNLVQEPSGMVDLPFIQGQIRDAGRPVGIRIARDDNTAHVMAIVGFEGDGPSCQLTIEDPFFGRDRISYDTLRNHRYKNGRWSHTYFTK